MLVKKIFNFPTYIFLIVIGGLLFIPILGAVPLFDIDEIYYAEITREMLLSHNWLQPNINFSPIYNTPPLFMWLQAFCMKYLGVNQFAARLPNAICGILTILVIYRLGKRLYSPYFGLIWALVYTGSFAPQFYFRTSLAEPWFNLFVFLGIYHISRILAVNQEPGEFYRRSDIKKWLIYSACFTALAMLIKGPVGFILVWLTVIITFVSTLARTGMGYTNFLKWILLTVFLFFIWLFYDMYRHGWDFSSRFLQYQLSHWGTQTANEKNFWYYHILILLAGCFPASAFVFQGFVNVSYEPVYQKILRQMMVSCLIAVVLFYTILKTNIIHYSTVAYLPISFLAALNINRIIQGEIKWTWIEYLILFIIGLFWCIVLIGIPYSGAHLDIIKPVVQDKFLIGMLQADVKWESHEIIFGIVYSVFFVLSFILFLIRKNIAAVLTLFISTGYITQILVYYFVPKIERYSQGALIEFCEAHAQEHVIIRNLEDVSYAHLFYAKQTKHPAHMLSDSALIYGPMIPGKDIYFTSRIEHYPIIQKHKPYLQELYQKNGYVFWIKKQ